jgi:hypothetical protein
MMGVAIARKGYGFVSLLITVALLVWPGNQAWAMNRDRAPTDQCPTVQSTPAFTFAYGAVTVNGQSAAVGTIILAYSPRGAIVGCSVVTSMGAYGAMSIYGEDNSVTPAVPGMRNNETVTFRIFETPATATPALVWHNDREVHAIALAVTVTAPVAPQLTIAVSGADLQLTWTTAPANLTYEVHHSNTPFTQPSPATLLSTQPASSTAFTHVNAVSDVTHQHYYLVRAVGNSSAVADSAPVGAVSYPLNQNSNRYSMIGLPFATTDLPDAAAVAAHVGHVQGVLKWNAPTQTFRFFVPPATGDNFPVQPGDAIFLQMGSGGPPFTTVTGPVTAVQITLTPGAFNFLTIPPQKATLMTAADTATDIGGVTALLNWHPNTQLFRFFAPPNAGDHFAVAIGTPLVVNLSSGGPTQWP